MAIKNAKKMKNLFISYDYVEICPQYLEKLRKNLPKNDQLFHIITTLENSSKYNPWNSRKNAHQDAMSQRFYIEIFTTDFMLGVWWVFSE